MNAKTERKRFKITASGSMVTWDMGGNWKVTVNTSDLPDAVRQYAMVYGFKQWGSDAYATNSGDADAYAKLMARIDKWRRGIVREDGELERLANALARVKGITVERAYDWLTEQAQAPSWKDTRASLIASPKMQTAILDIERERLEAKAKALPEEGETDALDTIEL